MKDAICAVYIVTNSRHTVLYTGVTSDLQARVRQHQAGTFPSSFSSRYNTSTLVFFEVAANIAAAITREKQIKGWVRRRKVALIESMNPHWNDLAADWSI